MLASQEFWRIRVLITAEGTLVQQADGMTLSLDSSRLDNVPLPGPSQLHCHMTTQIIAPENSGVIQNTVMESLGNAVGAREGRVTASPSLP